MNHLKVEKEKPNTNQKLVQPILHTFAISICQMPFEQTLQRSLSSKLGYQVLLFSFFFLSLYVGINILSNVLAYVQASLIPTSTSARSNHV